MTDQEVVANLREQLREETQRADRLAKANVKGKALFIIVSFSAFAMGFFGHVWGRQTTLEKKCPQVAQPAPCQNEVWNTSHARITCPHPNHVMEATMVPSNQMYSFMKCTCPKKEDAK